MRPIKWILSSLFLTLLTAFVLTHSGWLASSKANHAPQRKREIPPQANAANPLDTESGRRWQSCMPNHWRGYMLQQQR